MKHSFTLREGNEHYDHLLQYAETRTKEISGMAEAYIKITDRYGRLISRVVLMLGTKKPQDTQDVVIRDLIADVFDFLYESRPLILSGKLSIAFPIARRAYESLSLLHLSVLDKSWAHKWHEGREIKNAEVRKELASHPMGESEEQMKKLYSFFCLATHPNRGLIPRRFLGEGNKYVLGVILKPSLAMVVDYCIKILSMWFWFAAAVTYFYRDLIAKDDKGYFEAYHQAAAEAQNVSKWLVDSFNHLLKEGKKH